MPYTYSMEKSANSIQQVNNSLRSTNIFTITNVCRKTYKLQNENFRHSVYVISNTEISRTTFVEYERKLNDEHMF